MSHYQTLFPENQLRIICPIFNAETKFSDCVRLRHKVWRGERPAVRQGCQACMSAGKCPVAVIVQRMAMAPLSAPMPDDYHASEPRRGKLKADVLERIAPVIVTERVMARYSLSDTEISAITSANARISKQAGSAPEPTSSSPSPRKKPARKRAPDNAVNQAAASGDMSAALNKD
jgi:hypothetical protein